MIIIPSSSAPANRPPIIIIIMVIIMVILMISSGHRKRRPCTNTRLRGRGKREHRVASSFSSRTEPIGFSPPLGPWWMRSIVCKGQSIVEKLWSDFPIMIDQTRDRIHGSKPHLQWATVACAFRFRGAASY
eukprot:695986-Rhodomonas_salina.2